MADIAFVSFTRRFCVIFPKMRTSAVLSEPLIFPVILLLLLHISYSCSDSWSAETAHLLLVRFSKQRFKAVQELQCAKSPNHRTVF
jgi:hypothetical protein